MSINFERELSSNELQVFTEIMQSEVSVMDSKTALINSNNLNANKLNQPLTVELNNEGDIKVMLDGTKYRCTSNGWVKLGSNHIVGEQND